MVLQHIHIIIPPHNEVAGGGGWGWGVGGLLVSLRPSVRPASRVSSVVPAVLVGSVSYLYILSSNFRRCVTCEVSCKNKKFEFFAFFFNL